MNQIGRLFTILGCFALVTNITACTTLNKTKPSTAESSMAGVKKTEKTKALPNGEIYVLYTSDVHCGVDQGFGYAGVEQVQDTLEEKGYETILVDNGDAIQGEAIGTLSQGGAIVELMNEVGYDIAIPGNHEFDYGMERFLELADQADYQYISCNFNHDGELVFDPYVIKEVRGLKIAFVGVTTPISLTSSTPTSFTNEKGEYVYGFMQDDSGETLYKAVQKSIDSAKAEGADLVYVMGHMGMIADCEPWTYADVIEHTRGIDVFLDGHSHDTEQIVMKDAVGHEVTRSAVGTKLNSIGYSHISSEGEVLETGIWRWANDVSATDLLDIENEITDKVDDAEQELAEEMDTVVASTMYKLTIDDPIEVDQSGEPIWMIRRAETNIGDLCADAYRDQAGSDIAIVNGGGIRTNIEKGDITYGDIIDVHPYGNMLCVIEVTGQQMLDALEWGVRKVPEQSGAFLQVSGLSFEIHTDIDSPCLEDEKNMYGGIKGPRRIQHVMVGNVPLDPQKTYTLAGHDYMLLNHGDGYTMFDDCPLLQDRVQLDNQVLIDYIVDTLGGIVGDEYSDPYGQGRIVIVENES